MSEQTRKLYHSSLLLLSLVLFLGLGLYVQKHTQAFVYLKSIRPDYIVLLLLVHAFDFYFVGMIQKLPLKIHRISLTFKEWYGLSVTAELFNMLLPAKGGTGIRMLYMKDKKGLPLREFLSMSFAVVMIGFTFLGSVGLLYCHFFLLKNQAVFVLLESVFLAMAVSGFFLLFFAEALRKVFNFKRRYSPKIYLKDKKLITQTTLCWIGVFLLYPIKVYLAFSAIGIEINFIDSFEISLILLIASLFQVLPGNMGVKEIVTAYIGKQYGIEFEAALLASLIDRVILLLFLFPVGFYFYWQLFLEASLPKFLVPKLKQSAQTSP